MTNSRGKLNEHEKQPPNYRQTPKNLPAVWLAGCLSVSSVFPKKTQEKKRQQQNKEEKCWAQYSKGGAFSFLFR